MLCWQQVQWARLTLGPGMGHGGVRGAWWGCMGCGGMLGVDGANLFCSGIAWGVGNCSSWGEEGWGCMGCEGVQGAG